MDMQVFFNLFVAVSILVIVSAQIESLPEPKTVKQALSKVALRAIQIWSLLAVAALIGILASPLLR